MEEIRNEHKILEGNREGKREARRKLEDNIGTGS
jgi:hypothetical protein